MPAAVEIVTETERARGWEFQVQFIGQSGELVPLLLSLSWQDYDLYCPDGAVPPQTVAKAVALVAWELWTEGLPRKLDAAALRRRDHQADQRVTQHVDLNAM